MLSQLLTFLHTPHQTRLRDMGVVRVYLFGSSAMRRASRLSDLDISLELTPGAEVGTLLALLATSELPMGRVAARDYGGGRFRPGPGELDIILLDGSSAKDTFLHRATVHGGRVYEIWPSAWRVANPTNNAAIPVPPVASLKRAVW